MALVGEPDLVDGDDVGMITKGPQYLGLSFELLPRGAVQHAGQQHLDRHDTLQRHLDRSRDHAESAAADLADVVEPSQLHPPTL